MKKIFFIIIILSIFPIKAEEKENLENHFSYSFLWEIVFPGINFYKNEQIGWGNFFLITRILTLYYSIHYHNQYISYKSLENAAKIADLYYGPGYSYKDPIKSGYKTTKEFSLEAGRSLAYRNLSIGIHFLFLGIGIYKGYLDNVEDFFKNSPEFSKTVFYAEYQPKHLSFKISIPLDF